MDPQDAGAASPITPERLCEIMAARLCHDFMSPASGIASGLDFLNETDETMRAEAMNLIAGSARKLMDLLAFYRVALGGFAEGADFDTKALEALARGVFAHVRPELDWAVDVPAVSGAAARVLLNLAHLAAGAVAMGGVARVSVRSEPGWLALIAEANGPRARLQPEVAAGLKGEALREGLPGRWVQAFCLHAQVSAAGGALAAEPGEGGVLFKAVLPA
jgi:histidine phosphotransferase ChpT